MTVKGDGEKMTGETEEGVEFDELFGKHLGRRREAFAFIVGRLLGRTSPFQIIETGCVRAYGDWGAGMSTCLWNWVITKRPESTAISIDNSPTNVALARSLCPKVSVTCEDSIRALSNFGPVPTLALLYLDSFDYYEGQKAQAQLHHAGELAAIWERLPRGCLVAVDDAWADREGKHVLVEDFFRKLGVEPLVGGYTRVWEKP